MIILTAGSFGTEVGRLLTLRMGAKAVSLVDARHGLEELLPAYKFVAVALWRPYVGDCERIDDICHAHGIPWSLATVIGTLLSCGPLVIPGSGPCYHCYRRRYLSHHPTPDRELALRLAYERDPELGVPGYVQPMVSIAAGALMEDSSAPASEAGRFRIVDVLTAGVLETTVIGIHACPLCRKKRTGMIGARYVEDLIPAVEEIIK